MNQAQKRVFRICQKLNEQYANDFIGWTEKYIKFGGLKHNRLTWQQEEIANALITHNNVCVSAGGGLGKSALAALLTLWFLSTHPFSKVPTTAPSGKQLKDVLWSEIAFWLRRCTLQDIYELRSEKLYIKGFPEWYAVARTVPKDTNKASLNDTLAGFHAKDLLVLVDEASGVPDPVFTALEGASTNVNTRTLLISNPVSTGGYYYDTINDPAGKGASYKVLYYDSRESPLVDKEYEDRIIARYGKDSSMYRAKVLGMPIALLETVCVPTHLYDKVVSQNKEHFGGSYVMAIDVGGLADRTVFCHRRGRSIISWDVFSTGNPTDIIKETLRVWETKYKGENFKVVVDALGPGSGVASELRDKNLFEVIEFRGSEKAIQPSMYANRRSEGFYHLSRGFERLHFPVEPPEDLKKELANLFFDYSQGPIMMEPKKKFIGRVGFSPDHADALMMSEYAGAGEVSMLTKCTNPMVHRKRRFANRGGSKYGKFGRFMV